MRAIQVILKDASDNIISTIMAQEKEFSTGSKGFHWQGKLDIDGERYQAQVQIVKIGSKRKEK
jgi:hypothetical protein